MFVGLVGKSVNKHALPHVEEHMVVCVCVSPSLSLSLSFARIVMQRKTPYIANSRAPDCCGQRYVTGVHQPRQASKEKVEGSSRQQALSLSLSLARSLSILHSQVTAPDTLSLVLEPLGPDDLLQCVTPLFRTARVSFQAKSSASLKACSLQMVFLQPAVTSHGTQRHDGGRTVRIHGTGPVRKG